MDYQTPAKRIARSLVVMEAQQNAALKKHPNCAAVSAVAQAMNVHHAQLRKALDECAGALGLDVAILLSAGGK